MWNDITVKLHYLNGQTGLPGYGGLGYGGYSAGLGGLGYGGLGKQVFRNIIGLLFKLETSHIPIFRWLDIHLKCPRIDIKLFLEIHSHEKLDQHGGISNSKYVSGYNGLGYGSYLGGYSGYGGYNGLGYGGLGHNYYGGINLI